MFITNNAKTIQPRVQMEQGQKLLALFKGLPQVGQQYESN